MSMMRTHSIGEYQKDDIERKITAVLKRRNEIEFAYLHGSFLEGDFRDIDLAIYLNKLKTKKDALEYELALERELENIVNIPVDVRVLNNAPLSFRFNTIKGGRLLFGRDEMIRCEFESLTFVKHHDFKFHRDTYRREALGIGVQ